MYPTRHRFEQAKIRLVGDPHVEEYARLAPKILKKSLRFRGKVVLMYARTILSFLGFLLHDETFVRAQVLCFVTLQGFAGRFPV